MIDIARLTAELDRLEHIQADLAAVATRVDAQRRLDLVQLRKHLAGQILVIGAVAEPVFANKPDLLTMFRSHYSAMRSAAALHQAEWPAVRLGEVDDLYRLSAIRVREKNRVFVAWLRETLALLSARR